MHDLAQHMDAELEEMERVVDEVLDEKMHVRILPTSHALLHIHAHTHACTTSHST